MRSCYILMSLAGHRQEAKDKSLTKITAMDAFLC